MSSSDGASSSILSQISAVAPGLVLEEEPLAGSRTSIVLEGTMHGEPVVCKIPLRDEGQLRDRYAQLAEHLAQSPVPALVAFRWDDQAVRVRDSLEGVLTMPLVRGHELEQWLALGQSVEAVLDVAQQVTKLGAALEAAGLTHGDIEPANLMVTADQQLVLLDLDGCVPTNTADHALPERGTDGFAHPERIAHGTWAIHVDAFACLAIDVGLRRAAHTDGLVTASAWIPPDALGDDRHPIWRELAVSGDAALATRAALLQRWSTEPATSPRHVADIPVAPDLPPPPPGNAGADDGTRRFARIAVVVAAISVLALVATSVLLVSARSDLRDANAATDRAERRADNEAERADTETERADTETERADAETERADVATERAAGLGRQLANALSERDDELGDELAAAELRASRAEAALASAERREAADRTRIDALRGEFPLRRADFAAREPVGIFSFEAELRRCLGMAECDEEGWAERRLDDSLRIICAAQCRIDDPFEPERDAALTFDGDTESWKARGPWPLRCSGEPVSGRWTIELTVMALGLTGPQTPDDLEVRRLAGTLVASSTAGDCTAARIEYRMVGRQ